jgi:TonB family protein
MATVSHTAMDQFLPDYSSQFLSDLQGLLEKAGRFTGATSAAMAFVEGQELVTKVSMGNCAPDPGSHSPIQGSFTGLCVQHHDVQRCDDASKDDRVDAATCQALGIASMVIVPISESHGVLGVLAAFSAKPNAFSPTHVALLRTIADIVIELRKRYPTDPRPAGLGTGMDPDGSAGRVESPLVHSAPEVGASRVTPAVAKAPAMDPPVSAAAPAFAPPPGVPETKTPVAEARDSEMNEAAKLHASMATLPVAPEPKKAEPPAPPKVESPKQDARIIEASPLPEKKPLGPVLVKPEAKAKAEPAVEMWKREPLLIKNTEETEEYARVLPEPKKESDILSTAADIGFIPVVKEEQAETHPMFGYGYETAKTTRGSSFPVVKIVIAVVALAAFAVGATWFFRHNSPAPQPQAVQAAAPQDQVSTQKSEITSPQVTSDAGSTPAATGPSVATVLRKTDLKTGEGKKELKVPESEPVPDQTIILNGGTVPKRPVTDEAVAPPKIEADGTNGMSNLLSMVKPTQPEAAFRASSISSPVLIKQVAPQFPAFARQMHIQSDRVVLNGTVNKDGSVSNIKVIRGKQIFVGPAVSAVRDWKYKPAMLNGEATSSTVEIVVNFVDR